MHFRTRRRESKDWAGQWCTGEPGGSTGSWPFPEPSVSQSVAGICCWVVEHETCIFQEKAYRVTRQVDSYILLQSIWGVPPAGGPLLQLATAQAGQVNSPN